MVGRGRNAEGREFQKQRHEEEGSDKRKEVTTSVIARNVKEGFGSDAKVFRLSHDIQVANKSSGTLSLCLRASAAGVGLSRSTARTYS